MSYSFYEVLPFMLVKDSDELYFNYEIFKDFITNEDELEELSEAFSELTSDDPYDVVFTIPKFIGQHYETHETREFEAMIFDLKIGKAHKVMDDCYEGKTWYHNVTHFIDKNTQESMTITSYYYANNYQLLDIHIELKAKKKVKEVKKTKNEKPSQHTVFVLMEIKKKKYKTHGIFTNISSAVNNAAVLKQQHIIKHGVIQIEEIPLDKPLTYQHDNSDHILLDCIHAYNENGQLIENK